MATVMHRMIIVLIFAMKCMYLCIKKNFCVLISHTWRTISAINYLPHKELKQLYLWTSYRCDFNYSSHYSWHHPRIFHNQLTSLSVIIIICLSYRFVCRIYITTGTVHHYCEDKKSLSLCMSCIHCRIQCSTVKQFVKVLCPIKSLKSV